MFSASRAGQTPAAGIRKRDEGQGSPQSGRNGRIREERRVPVPKLVPGPVSPLGAGKYPSITTLSY